MFRKCKPNKYLAVKTMNNYARNVPQILLMVPKLLLFLGKNLTARDVLRAVSTEESVENVSDFIVQPEERPDFRLSCLSGPTSSTDSLQSPLEGSSQPANETCFPSESIGLEFSGQWFHFDIVYFTVYTYCKGNCYSSLNMPEVIYRRRSS